MHRSFATLARVVAAFSSTNLDDSLLLAGLFVGVEFSPRSVIVGQFIGMGIVVLASLAAALLAVTSPWRMAGATWLRRPSLAAGTVLER